MHATTFVRARNAAARACNSAAATSAPKSARRPRSPARVTFGCMRADGNVPPMSDEHVHSGCNHSDTLKDIARQTMIDRGLAPDFSPEAEKQAESISSAANETDASI